MSSIWIPISVTLLTIILVVCDISDEWEEFKKQWFLSLIALSIKPGLFVAAAWVVWATFN